MPGSTRILDIGAGATGSAAIRELAQHEEITTTAIIDTEVTPYKRTLIKKAVRNQVHAESTDGRDITADLVVTALGTRSISPLLGTDRSTLIPLCAAATTRASTPREAWPSTSPTARPGASMI